MKNLLKPNPRTELEKFEKERNQGNCAERDEYGEPILTWDEYIEKI